MKNLKHKQTGVALAIGLMLLLVVSVIGITSMKSALLQENMAAGLKNRELSDAAALTLLAAGERYLQAYYEVSNGTTLTAGVDPIIAPRSDLARRFKTERNLNEGFLHPFGVNLTSEFGGMLATEPRLIIEDFSSASGSTGDTGNTSFQTTVGESDNASAAGSSGTIADADSTNQTLTYRVVSKATDSTGHLFTGFESVISVKIN
ncbi:hypothetical protein MNBD_GAMMA01-2325 [hydrothermal vent metagenome]|uniref:Type 4 fimbrial biogenesis protein PilX N-terminal domain-containing protein n=1 Tax=hydrothermal vent metagenome TaxID=652676 RepID=A0A3B0W739_9ZZZZ